MESVLKKAYQVELGDKQEAGQVCTPALTRPLNPEDIELARKRAEHNLYLEKEAQEVNVDLLGSIAGVGDMDISSMGMER
jgi:hypothetical protein